MKGEFYKMEYESWDEGTDSLTLEQEAAYLRLCHQMYRRKGGIPNGPATLARIWRCHPNKARKLLADLVAAGKVQDCDGVLTNTRVTRELDDRETRSRQRADAGHTGGTRTQENRRNPLKTNEADEAPASTPDKQNQADKRREEKKPPKAPEGGLPEGWADFWEAYPKRPGGNPEEPARRRYAKALEAGATPETLLAALRLYIDQMGKLKKLNTEFVKQARFWLSPDFYPDWIRMVQRAEEKAAQKVGNSQFSDDMWRKFVGHWRKTGGQWSLGERSPPPDHVQTKVPRAILAEFNIHSERQRAA